MPERDSTEKVRRIATEIMGWRVMDISSRAGRIWFDTGEPDHLCFNPQAPVGEPGTWNSYTSISDAFVVVDKMRERGLELTLHGMGSEGYHASFQALHQSRSGPVGTGNTVCAAISEAALATLEGKP